MGVKFEWDQGKAASNLAKHGVPFEEAVGVFADPLARVFNDESHSMQEQREIIIGHSDRGRLLLVSFTARDEAVRVLSARKATKMERKDYEENARS